MDKKIITILRKLFLLNWSYVILFMKEFFENLNFEKKVSKRQQKHEKLPSMGRLEVPVVPTSDCKFCTSVPVLGEI